MPKPVVVLPWGSASTTNTRRSLAAREAPRFMAVVVFPTPPFWLVIAMTLAIRQILSEFHVKHFNKPPVTPGNFGRAWNTGEQRAIRSQLQFPDGFSADRARNHPIIPLRGFLCTVGDDPKIPM